MPEFVLNRNYSLRTLHGHIIDFKKGQPVYVPSICAREAAAIGAEAVGEKVDPLGPEAAAAPSMTPDERRDSILAAFKILEERNARNDFTAAGRPSKTALVAILEFDVDKGEFEPLWTEYRASKGSDE